MSVLYRAKGIVLARCDHKEVDRFYSVFTKEHGKIQFLARGGHKSLAKLTPHLESIAEVELLLVRGRYFDTVAGVDRIRRFKLDKGLQKQVLAQHALHLVDMGTKEWESDEILYSVLSDWLHFLATIPELEKDVKHKSSRGIIVGMRFGEGWYVMLACSQTKSSFSLQERLLMIH